MLRTGILAVLLLRDTVLARYMLWPCVCVSRVADTSRSCTKTAKK